MNFLDVKAHYNWITTYEMSEEEKLKYLEGALENYERWIKKRELYYFNKLAYINSLTKLVTDMKIFEDFKEKVSNIIANEKIDCQHNIDIINGDY